MKRVAVFILLLAFSLALSLVIVRAVDAASDHPPKCNKACQKKNDHWFLPSEYDDYFVNDSDGKKDLVFSVYRNVRIGDYTCSVIKSDNYSISAVCPGAVSTQGYAPPVEK